MIDIEVPAVVLKAVAAVAPKKDRREYLVSVCLDMSAKGAHLIATNGVMLAAVRISKEAYQTGSVIIPVSLAAQVKTRNGFVRIVVPDREPGKPGARKITLMVGGNEYSVSEIDANYPDWRRVIPQNFAGGTATFSPGVAMKAMQFWESLGARIVEIMFNGAEGAAKVEGRGSAWSDDAVFVMMPCRR